MNIKNMIISLTAGVCLLGCSSVVGTTLMQINALDPLSVDPADVAVSLTLPEGIDVQTGSAELSFTTRRGTSDVISKTYVLERNGDVFEIAQADWPEMRAMQAQVRIWKAEPNDDSSGSIGISLSPCTIAGGPSPDARVSVSIRTIKDGIFLPLVRNGPLSAVVSPDDLAQMADCS